MGEKIIDGICRFLANVPCKGQVVVDLLIVAIG
jgi:hypothetical protein